MGSYDDLTVVSMTITGPTSDDIPASVERVLRRFLRDDIVSAGNVAVSQDRTTYEATVTLWPKAPPTDGPWVDVADHPVGEVATKPGRPQ